MNETVNLILWGTILFLASLYLRELAAKRRPKKTISKGEDPKNPRIAPPGYEWRTFYKCEGCSTEFPSLPECYGCCPKCGHNGLGWFRHVQRMVER